MSKATDLKPDAAAIQTLVRYGLTEKQTHVYLYIFTTAMECGYQPSLRDIMSRIGVTSPNSIALIINSLEISGFIKRKKSDGRCLKILRTPSGTPFRGFTLPEDTP